MRFIHSSIVFLLLTAIAASLQAHDDVVPYELNGKIFTGGHDDALGTDTIVQRVFGYDFGEEPSDPYIIGDPGFNNGAFGIGIFPNDGLLPVNQTLTFSVLTNLQYWDGTGSVSFDAAPAGVDLGIKRGSFTLHVSGTGQSGVTPTLGGTAAAGRLHVHVESQLNFTDGTDLTLPNAPEGIYLVGLELALPGLTNSDPIYFLYNNGLDEEIHDEAINWVEANLVPEPSSLSLAAISLLGMAAFGRQRRRLR